MAVSAKPEMYANTTARTMVCPLLQPSALPIKRSSQAGDDGMAPRPCSA